MSFKCPTLFFFSMSMGDISEDLFVGLILVSLIEIPSYIFCVLTMDHVGRKPLFVYALALTGKQSLYN